MMLGASGSEMWEMSETRTAVPQLGGRPMRRRDGVGVEVEVVVAAVGWRMDGWREGERGSIPRHADRRNSQV